MDMLETLTPGEGFKCSRCENYLSIPPILVLENSIILCGRCENSAYEGNSNPKTERQVLFEKLAEKWKFPCRYESDGCKDILEWNNPKEHEENCLFGKMNCYFNSKRFGGNEECEWIGDNRDYFKHIEENHTRTNNIIEELDIWEDPKNQLFRLDVFNNILLVFLVSINNVYHLMILGDAKKLPVRYKVEVSDDSEENVCIFSRVSGMLPFNINKIETLGLKLKVNFTNPKYLSIYFKEKYQCVGKCGAGAIQRCEGCRKLVESSVSASADQSNNNIKCDNCSKSKSLSPYFTMSQNTSSQKTFVSKHYKCENMGCSFHGNFRELKFHDGICPFKNYPDSIVGRFNFPYNLQDYSTSIFYFDNCTFRLEKGKDEYSLNFFLKTSEIRHKFEIEILKASFKIMTLVIFPSLDFIEQNTQKVQIPFNLLPKNGIGDDYTFKFNISRINDTRKRRYDDIA